MEVGNAGTFRTVHVQKASLAEILKEIDRQYTGKSTMELLADLPRKRKPGRQPGWRKPPSLPVDSGERLDPEESLSAFVSGSSVDLTPRALILEHPDES
jgi:hypothetical protein